MDEMDEQQTAAEPIAGDDSGYANGAENDMASLLAASDEQFRQLKYGDVVEGTIMRKDPEEILVDIGFKSEGIIPNNEFQSLTSAELAALSVGDEVLVSVLQPEDKEGHVVLSLDRARMNSLHSSNGCCIIPWKARRLLLPPPCEVNECRKLQTYCLRTANCTLWTSKTRSRKLQPAKPIP